MKQIKLKKTEVCENSDGVMEVFGIGKTYTLEDEIADALIATKSAVEVKQKRDERD